MIKYLIIHCSDTPGDVSKSTIDQWHKARGWSGFGYHYLIRTSGLIEKGRDLNEVGAHAKGFNTHSIGICLAGGVEGKNTFTEPQFTSLETLIRTLIFFYPTLHIVGHRDLPNVDKSCPSFSVYEWLQRINLADYFGM